MTECARLFRNYLRNYLFCCIFPDKTYDPSRFEENHYRYRAFFGAFHVKCFAVALIIARAVVFSLFLVYTFVIYSDGIVRLYAVFSFCMATASNLVLIAGIYYKRNNLILPSLLMAVLFIIYLILQLFINLLDTANTKDTLTMNSLLPNLLVFALLYFEIYTALIVWRVFVYVCDTRMDDEVKILEREKRIAERFPHQDLGDQTEPLTITLSNEAESKK